MSDVQRYEHNSLALLTAITVIGFLTIAATFVCCILILSKTGVCAAGVA